METEVKKMFDIQADIRRENKYIMEMEGEREKVSSGMSKHVLSYGLISLGMFFILSYFTMTQVRRIILAKKLN